ncbi:MAG TPA: cellulose binding domain-containing protein, partial [Terracidiphilus sp.]
TVTSFTPYQTTATESMEELSAVGVSGDAFTYSLPAQSITTFVGTASTSPGFSLSASLPTVSIGLGTSGTNTIDVTALNGFNGSVTLTASGLPSGVSAIFGTNPATASSGLTLTASSTATAGTYTVTITGTSGTLSSSTTFTLIVTGNCTQTPIVPFISVNGGSTWTEESTATVSSTATVVYLGPQPLTGTWSWTGPSGFTSTTRQINNIALSTGVNTYVATYTNAASCKSTQAFTVTVTGSTPSFTLAPTTGSASVTQGSNTTDTINVTDLGGFTGSVNLSASGLPSGVTATFGTNPATGSSLLTLAASSSATTGNFPITITGSSGSLTASTLITLTVSPAGTTGFACHIGYTISSQWAGGFGAAITINNTGTTAISNWTLTWSFANGQTISQVWNGNLVQSGANVTLTNLSYNGSIPAGGSYSGMGFNGTWNNATNAIPTSFAVNGTACK